MTRRMRLTILAAIASICVALLIVVAARPSILQEPKPPEGDVRELVSWLAHHPSDLEAAARIATDVLDSDLPQRRGIWRAAWRHAVRLAPRVPDAGIAYVRAGLFHWQELSPKERTEVLAAAQPLLRDPDTFAGLHRAIWQLTHDFRYLRRSAPDDVRALESLRQLAVTYGLFGHYRELRAAIRIERQQTLTRIHETARIRELTGLLPQQLSTADEPLVRVVLEELNRRPVDLRELDRRFTELTRYAVEHRLQPLGGLAPLVEQRVLRDSLRARLALALGDLRAATRIELTSGRDGPQWEIYFLERALLEASEGRAATADTYLARAAARGTTDAVLATGVEIGRIVNDPKMIAAYERQLASRKEPDEWVGTCSANEVCDAARARIHLAPGEALRLALSNVQSDATPPYAEIYVDDALVAEGPVGDARTFEVPAAAGLRTVEVRLVNRLTRGGIQRRLRLSRSTLETAAPRRTASVAGFDGMKKLKSNSAWTIAMARLASAAA